MGVPISQSTGRRITLRPKPGHDHVLAVQIDYLDFGANAIKRFSNRIDRETRGTRSPKVMIPTYDSNVVVQLAASAPSDR